MACPLRSTDITPLPRYYGASDFRQPPSRVPCYRRISLLHSPNLPTIPSPTTPCSPRDQSVSPPKADRPPLITRCAGDTASWTSPLPSRLVTATGRIEFASLRTGRSPPVALHPLSRGRSYLRLQRPDQAPVTTRTSLIWCARRRTGSAFMRTESLWVRIHAD